MDPRTGSACQVVHPSLFVYINKRKERRVKRPHVHASSPIIGRGGGCVGRLVTHGPEGALGAAIAANLVVLAVEAGAKDALDDGGLGGVVICHDRGLLLRRSEFEIGGGGRRGQRIFWMLDGAEGALDALCAAQLVVGWVEAGADDAAD